MRVRSTPRRCRQPRTVERHGALFAPAVALFAIVAIVLGGCGIPADSAAHPITVQSVPGTTSPAGYPGTQVGLSLYFVKDSHLVAVTRAGYAYPTIVLTVDELLNDLGNGPTASETARDPGLTTLLNTQPGITATWDPVSRDATININQQFFDTLFGPSLYEAYAQIVLTLMKNTAQSRLSSIRGVLFTYENEPYFAYLPTEQPQPAAVTAAPYLRLIETPNSR